MIKRFMYTLCLFAILFLSACKCPFCCCQKEAGKAIITPQTTNTTTKELSTQESKNHVEITNTEQFDKEIVHATTPAVVDFSADWCGACKASKPTFDAVAEQLGSTYKFVTIDIDKAEKIAQELGIQGIPTFVFFKNGKEVHRITGAITKKAEFISTIEKTFSK